MLVIRRVSEVSRSFGMRNIYDVTIISRDNRVYKLISTNLKQNG